MDRKQIGNNIKNMRLDLEMTQTELAEKANISNIHISHIENGHANMSIEALLGICDGLSVTPNDILLGEYYNPSIEDMVFYKYSHLLAPDDKQLLQNIFKYLEERERNRHRRRL